MQDREAERWNNERKGGRAGKTGVLGRTALKVGYVTAYCGAKLTWKRRKTNQDLVYHRSAVYKTHITVENSVANSKK